MLLLETPNISDIYEILIGLFLSFLLGYILAWYFYGPNDERKKMENLEREVHPENKTHDSGLKVSDPVMPSRRVTAISEFENPGEVKAVKTREREGQSVGREPTYRHTPDNLNWDRIGKGNPSNPDDLKKIVGVGPFIEENLNQLGIYNFSQIANFTSEDIQVVTALIQFFPGRIARDEWVQQAQEFQRQKK